MQYCFKNKNYIHYRNIVSLITLKLKKENVEKYNSKKENYKTDTSIQNSIKSIIFLV
ncbi:hypothetical protein C8J95_104217 [Elizabethkingia sp. YR214]|nr:hypothetical protein C8J95_104217 [Elizabethkingia sp. YR214]